MVELVNSKIMEKTFFYSNNDDIKQIGLILYKRDILVKWLILCIPFELMYFSTIIIEL